MSLLTISNQDFIPASLAETRRFLTTWTTADEDGARQLWDQHSGMKGLLDARWGNNRGYVYDAEEGRYIRLRNGVRVRDDELRRAVLRVSNHARDELRKETQQLIAGGIIFAVWYSRTRSLLKSLFYTLWLVSVGGFLFDDNTQRNLFYWFILNQFNWLDNFARQVETGEQELNVEAVRRAGMYGAAGNTTFQNMTLTQRRAQGYTEGRRVLGENENHCHDSGDRPGCVELADLGYIPIERIVPLGDASCYSNCHCYIEYRRNPRRRAP